MSRNPFAIEGPAVISFSGGRTSAYLLRQVLDAGLKPDVHVLFANTGKERHETLDFVHEVETRWKVQIHWLEYRTPVTFKMTKTGKKLWKANYAVVDYDTASRKGEPFDQLIAFRKRLPNRQQRMCTQELKIRPMREWMKDAGYAHWDMVIGLRADEPRRLANMRALNNTRTRERWENVMPLADADVVEADVLAFWKAQPFDLQLKTWEGNCDLCFLKTRSKRLRIMQGHPELPTWWIAKEAQIGQPFLRSERNYAFAALEAKKLKSEGKLVVLKDAPDETEIDCFCTQ